MDTNRLPKQALQYKPKGRRNVGRPRKRWRFQLHLEDQGTGNTPKYSWIRRRRWWWYICRFLIIKPTRCTNFSNLFLEGNSTCFGQFLCPSPGVFSLYTQQWYMSYRFADSLRTGSEWNCISILILLASCLQTCMTFTTAVCTVKNRGQRNCPQHVEFTHKNKFEKLVHLVWFIIRNSSRCMVTWTSK